MRTEKNKGICRGYPEVYTSHMVIQLKGQIWVAVYDGYINWNNNVLDNAYHSPIAIQRIWQ